MQLTETIKRQLETDKEFLTDMLSKQGKVDANVVLEEETGEVLIVLLMTASEIQSTIKKAVTEVLGANYSVSNIQKCCGNKLIIFTIHC